MSSAVDLKTKEEKDAELDRRIEALRKKNEALVKRYQEIEEDKKKAEQEGIAVTTPRKPRPHEPEVDRRKMEKENFSVTVDLSKPVGEKRVVNDWKSGMHHGRKMSEESDNQKGQNDGHSPPRRMGSGRVGRGERQRAAGGGGRQERREWEPRTPRVGDLGEVEGHGRRGLRRGRGGGGGEGGGIPGGIDRKSKEWEEKRRQNIEKMNEEMEKIAEYERGQRVDSDKPIRNFLDDPRRSGPVPEIDRKEGSRRHVRNWGGLDFENVKTGAEMEKEWTSRRPGPKGSVDMTMSMTGRERAEYLRWKKEREQIDEERLARHRNATGQWRREWDAQKSDNMFKEEPYAAAEGITSEQGSRRARGRNSHTEPRGRASDDPKRPPKTPTFGDFLSQGRTPGSRGRGRGQKNNYSMHDNRWEAEKDDEDEEEEEEKKDYKKTEEKEYEEEKPKLSKAEVEENDEEDDEDWEDASDGEEAEQEDERISRGNEKDSGKEKPDKSKEKSPSSPLLLSQPTSAESPKVQRTPRPKVHIPPPAATQESPAGGKPLSPFSPLDGHHPVSDWAEEMEMQSPRSSMGAESPLQPPSAEASPTQKKEQEVETESQAEPAEPQKDGNTAMDISPETESQENLMVSELESATTEAPSDATSSEFSVPAPPEASGAAVTTEEEVLAALAQADTPGTASSTAVIEADQRSSDSAGDNDDSTPPAEINAAPSEETADSSEQINTD